MAFRMWRAAVTGPLAPLRSSISPVGMSCAAAGATGSSGQATAGGTECTDSIGLGPLMIGPPASVVRAGGGSLRTAGMIRVVAEVCAEHMEPGDDDHGLDRGGDRQ